MPIQYAGIKYPIEDDCEILKINSPNAASHGSKIGIVDKPHVVVDKDEGRRWALVALTRLADDPNDRERTEPRIGMRWFHGPEGHPVSHDYAVWFVFPEKFHTCILQELDISEGKRKLVADFLDEEAVDRYNDGEILKAQWKTA